MSRPSHFVEPMPTVQRADIASLYHSRGSDPLALALGRAYQPPAVFEHGRETLVAEIEPTNADGHSVRVFETRAPAAFYAIEAMGFRLSTGTGAPRLAVAMVRDIANGCLCIAAIAPEGAGEGNG